MSAREWHVLISFGLLTGALALIDSQTALYMVGVAALVVTVKNAEKVKEALA